MKKYNSSSFNAPNLDDQYFTIDFEKKLNSDQYNFDQDAPAYIEQKVPVNSIDNYMKEKSIYKVDILKIKTQGYEIPILKGSIKALTNKKIRFVEVKVIFTNLYEEVGSIGSVDAILAPLGYKIIATDHYNSIKSSWIDLLYEKTP